MAPVVLVAGNSAPFSAYDGRMMRPVFVCLLAGLLAACAPTPGPSPSPSPSRARTPSPAATPAPTPTPGPDTLAVQVVKTGVGTYMLEARPVAILRNSATRHSASGVVAHFAVHAGDGSTFGIDSTSVSLAPEETLAVSAECTDTCNHATGTDLTVSVAGWTEAKRAVITGGAAAYACDSCGGGDGAGTVTGTLTGNIQDGSLVYETASCVDSTGAVVGGGLKPAQWPAGASAPASVAVLVRTPPASCQLFATLS